MTLRADHGLADPPPPPGPATHHHTRASHVNPDMRAAFMGLLFGSLALLAIVFVVSKLTSRSFEGHEAAPAAGAPAAGAPAAHPPNDH